MKKFKYLLLLILLIPFNVFANYDNTKYFNLVFPSSAESSFTSVYFGSNTTLQNLVDDLKNVDTSGRKLMITFLFSGTSFNKIVLSALEIGSMPYVNYYGTVSSGSTNLSFKNYIYNDLGTVNFTISPCITGGSILDSNFYSSFKSCLSTGDCSFSVPDETNFSCTITKTTAKSITNQSYTISNFDDSLESFDTLVRTFVYYSDLSITYKSSMNSTHINRNLHIENTLDIKPDDLIPSYYDFYNIPSPEPPEPDNPDIDTNVGVWKNYVLWFVDNDSIYGLLVNLYILMFVSIIGTSFIVFIKLIRKNRW